MKRVRTRVAPSPTGDPHVGTAYMALFSKCFAASQGGDFVLRIEDTDAVRSTARSEQQILDSLRWLGLTWDEGPDVGGPYGPYRQSERLETYQRYAKQLVDAGHAFPCFCSNERLDAMRREQMAAGQTARYDGLCSHLAPAAATQRIAAGERHVIRMRVPDEGVCTIDDLLRGPIEIAWSQIDMQVLLKADGYPTYHLAVVVDDHLMEISHIIRGEEWINSAPKHQLLFRYFGWEMPQLIHLSLLRNPDKSKLSKRKNPTSINYYRRMGFLPEAVTNYLGMLGWSMPDGEEKFTLAQMIERFDIQRVSLGAPVFDLAKLAWLNGRWIREDLDDAALAARLVEWALNPDMLRRIIPLVRERIDTFGEIAPMTGFLLAGTLDLKPEDLAHKQLSQEEVLRVLQFSLWSLETLEVWDGAELHRVLAGLATATGIKIRDFLAPLFVAVSGKPVSPPLFDSMAVLGPDLTRARLRHAMDVLGGVSNKQAKRLEKEFRELAGKQA